MTPKQVQTIKQGLLAQKQHILASAQKVRESELFNATQSCSDEVDQACFERSQALSLKLQSRDRALLIKIEQALGRIEDGIFGECLGCEEPIEFRRLVARPTAHQCIQCKEAEEKKERLFAAV